MNPIDLTGRRFGRWLVLEKLPNRKPGASKWTCICDCGTVKPDVSYTSLTQLRSQSCGCLRREVHQRPKSPRLNHPREYTLWQSMKTSCTNPRHPSFNAHGAKGATVHPSWLDFPTFLRDMGTAPPRATLKRIDPTLPFQPGNTTWSTRNTTLP